jgi:hypothetical protein
VTAHLPLVAALRNPTIRRRFIDVHAVLLDAGQADVYPQLLSLLGSSTISAARARQHLAALERAFDAAAAVIVTPFPFASDITADARSIALDGTRAMIDEGFAREAMFWLTASFARCQSVLHADAPSSMRDRFDRDFSKLLGDLRIESPSDLQQRAELVRQSIPSIRRVAEILRGAIPAS